ncbi:class I SAM-dependent methyltransferase [Pseudomonas sp. dw_612]|uniref:class I SAM-dependent methyltransferase n=1 Tax=Pseudomonas sp. dw_612 TaxID=2720080 RepID=UPI001BD375C5|nr:class I SAM-dependent methyltransferase [Pseudomonas sp. dw_612]
MNKPEFDKFADEYNQVLGDTIPDALNEDAYFAEYKIALMASRLKGKKITRILDFGCGAGRSLAFLKIYFPDSEIWGYDVSPESLKVASTQLPEATLFSDWSTLGEVRFDAIIAANVFHHIPVTERLPALILCRKSLSAEGQMFMFEHNPYNPLTRWIFERCPFDADAEMLSLSTGLDLAHKAGYASEQHAYTLFFPKQLAFLRKLEPWLKRLPLGAQYYVQMAG